MTCLQTVVAGFTLHGNQISEDTSNLARRWFSKWHHGLWLTRQAHTIKYLTSGRYGSGGSNNISHEVADVTTAAKSSLPSCGDETVVDRALPSRGWWGSCGSSNIPIYLADILAVDPALPSRGWRGSCGSNNIPLHVPYILAANRITLPSSGWWGSCGSKTFPFMWLLY